MDKVKFLGLVPFETLRDFIKTINPKKIVQYDGSIGTKMSAFETPYQEIYLRILYTGEEDDSNSGDFRGKES